MHTARFVVGASVEVLDLGKAGHVRIPFYVRHKVGRVVQLCGCYLNPEDLAVGLTAGPVIPLYRVEFRQRDLWPDYTGPEDDHLVTEIYDHWLAPAQANGGQIV